MRNVAGLLVLLAVLPYINALTAGFSLDDETVIRTNGAETEGVDPIRILASPLHPGDLYRPFTVLTFALNEALTPRVALPLPNAEPRCTGHKRARSGADGA